MNPSVGVSILAFRDKGSIGACVSSVLALEHDADLEIRVREQGQDEQQLREIQAAGRAAGRKPAFTIDRSENIGFARGHNETIRRLKGDYVLLVNADARLDGAFLKEALPYFDDPLVGSVQGKLITADERDRGHNLIDTTGFLATRRRLFLPRGQGEEDTGQYETPQEIFGVDGAVALYRRTALEDVAIDRSLNPSFLDNLGVEYLDETYFIYKCDLDLAWRLQLRGWKSIYAPTAVSRHDRTLKRGKGRTPRELLRQRRASPAWTRALSFCNHRLTLIKNDRLSSLVRDSARWLPAEAAAWGVAIGVERLGSAVTRFARFVRFARRKRAWIQARCDPAADPYSLFVS